MQPRICWFAAQRKRVPCGLLFLPRRYSFSRQRDGAACRHVAGVRKGTGARLEKPRALRFRLSPNGDKPSLVSGREGGEQGEEDDDAELDQVGSARPRHRATLADARACRQ